MNAQLDDLGAGIDRVLSERDLAQSKLEHARRALRLVADTTTDEKSKSVSLAALDVIGGA